jgi:RecA-family ATPase
MIINPADQGRTPTFWAAPEIAGAGYPVFPISPGGKSPSVEGGFYAQSLDHSEIAAWIEEGRGHHNIAVPTGVGTRLVVVEADTPDALERMSRMYGDPAVRTKRGGHWYFSHPRNGKVFSNKVEAGLDRKGDGGYVLVPPSLGRAWTNGIPKPEDLPALPEEFQTKRRESSEAERRLDKSRKDRAAGIVAGHVRTLEEGGEGSAGRHEHLKHLCGVLLSRGVALGDAEDILVGAWTKTGDAELSERAGHEVPNTLRTTETAIAEGRATGVPRMEAITPGLFGELSEALGWAVNATSGEKSQPRNGTRGGVNTESQSLSSNGVSTEDDHALERRVEAVSFAGRRKPAPREWIVQNLLPKGHSSAFYGAGGVAKSMLALHLALTVADEDRNHWMGRAAKHVPVLYLDFELDADEQHRRALELTAGMSFEDIPGDFYYLNGASFSPLEAFLAAADEIRRLGAGLVVVDSVGFALAGDSEASKDVMAFHRNCVQPLKTAGATPLLIDHQAKLIKGERYADKGMFGSVYKSNQTRSNFQIRGASEDGAITASFAHGKNSFGPKAEDFSVRLSFAPERIMVEKLDEAVRDPDREPSKRELILGAVVELGRATSETVQRKTGCGTQTVRNAISELLNDGELVDTGEKQGRYRVVSPSSILTLNTTKGPGLSIGEELQRSGSGAAQNLPHFLAGTTSLEILTKSVLRGLGKEGGWLAYAEAVEKAATDPANHPLDCVCGECS